MKMKSKFFGFTAKLAMAILAVGTMFTSCYDSENGDVTKPYVAPDPVYTISGTVTDALTNQILTSATITVNGTSATNTDGTYTVKGKAGENIVVVSATGYEPVTRNVIITALEKGEASTTVVNVALTKEGTININDVEITYDSTPTIKSDVLKTEDNLQLDLTADENSATFERVFKITVGAELNKDLAILFADAPSGLLDYVKSYLGAIVGQFGEKKVLPAPYTIVIPPNYCVTSVTITYNGVVTDYTVKYDNKSYSFTLTGLKSYSFSTQFLPNHGFSHSHGHGHGHGDDLNAGGGIFE